MNNSVESYKYFKLLSLIIFDSTNDYEDMDWLFNVEVLKDLKNIIINNYNDCLISKTKDNVLNFLNHARKIKDENAIARILVIDEIIQLINVQEEDKFSLFYRLQLYKRRKDKIF